LQATNALADYLKEKGIAITVVSEGTGLGYNELYRSLGKRDRPIRGDELLIVCAFLEIDPKRFTPQYQPKNKTA
jgi:lambda repressor-like predicted transcriptional regulator